MQKERTADLSPIGGSRRTGYTSKLSAFDRQFIVCIEIFSERYYMGSVKNVLSATAEHTRLVAYA